MRRVSLPGAFLLGLSTFQAEFDFGVPQFRMVFAPMLIMLAAGVSLVAARVWLGRGAALGAALFFLAMRGLMALLVGPVLGEPTAPLPAVPRRGAAGRADRAVRAAAAAVRAGVAASAIGTVGLAAEWGWTHVWMLLPWPAALLPEGVVLGSRWRSRASLVGAWLGARLAADRAAGAALGARARRGGDLRAGRLRRCCSTGIAGRARDGRAGEPRPAGERDRARRPADGADDAEWLTATAWQGGGLVVDRLERVAPGVYRTTEPIPVNGDWKTMIRLHRGNALTALPVYLPEDPAIPVEGVPARRLGRRARSGPSRSCSSASARPRRAGCGRSPTASCWLIALGVPRVAGLGRAPRVLGGRLARRDAVRARKGPEPRSAH